MEFVTARDLRINTSEVWEKLKTEKDLIITLNGRPLALMAGISGRDLEDILKAVRRARAERSIREMQRSVPGKENIHEIEQVIQKARRERNSESRS